MKKISDVTSTADKNGEWTNGNVAAGIPPTVLESGWLNSVQREILGVLTKAGIPQDKNNDNQLSEAISKIITGGNYATVEDLKKKLTKDQNGADIPDKSKFIENLGLKEQLNNKFDKTGGTITGAVLIKFDGRGLAFDAPGKDSANYMEFSAGGERIAYLGFGSNGTKSFTFSNTKTDVTLRIEDKVTVNGIPVMLESVGIFGEFPHRATQLPAGWYSVNGDRFDTTSPQGKVIKSLPTQLKSDWGISESGGKINLPNIKQSDGRTPFLRPINGTSQQVGSVIGDQMRNLTGGVYLRQRQAESSGSSSILWNMSADGEALTTREYSTTAGPLAQAGTALQKTNTIELNARNQVPTGPEFKPLDIGVTLAIYLGV